MSERLQIAVSNTIEAGYQLDSEAFTFLEMLSKTKDPVALMEEVVKKMEEFAQKPLFIDRPLLEGLMLEARRRGNPTITATQTREAIIRYESGDMSAEEVLVSFGIDPSRELATTTPKPMQLEKIDP